MAEKTFKKLLVCLDGSKNSLRGLNLALALAKPLGSRIFGINIISIPFFIKSSPEIIKKKEQESRKILDQAQKASKKVNVPFTSVNRINDNIGKAIIGFSESKKADMIIIGSRGPDPEGGLFIGSVANHLIHKSKIPVTVVK